MSSQPESADLAQKSAASGAAPPPTVSLQPGYQATISLQGLSSAIQSQATAETPQQFGDYDIVRKIASGGMGVVYEARQRSLQRTVALKMIRAGELAGEAEITRFYAEAEAAAGLRHPHIVADYEVGRWGETGHYFTMDYIAGPSLAQVIRQQPLEPRRAATLMAQVARAIHFAHEKGVLHRDLKPSNILLDEHEEPRVADFGLAKRWQNGSGQTIDGTVLGTPSYMAPEQAQADQQRMGPASDVYSLGAVLYECLTTRPPFVATSLAEILRLVVEEEPLPPSRLARGIPRDLETICLKCLEKDPIKRYTSAAALAADLDRYLRDEPIQARPISALERARKFVRRNPAWTALGGVLALAVASVMAISLAYSQSLATKNLELTTTVRKLDKALGEVTTQSALAHDRYESLRSNTYATQIKQTESYYLSDPPNLARGEELLNSLLPLSGETDLRGLEWHFLHRALQQTNLRCKFPNPINFFTVHADGTIAFISRDERNDRNILWLQSPNGQPVPTVLQRNGPEISKVYFSRESDYFVCIDNDATVELRKTLAPDQLLFLIAAGEQGKVGGLETHGDISADGQLVAWAGFGGQLHLWSGTAVDDEKGRPERTIETKLESPAMVRISPDKRWVAVLGQREGMIVDLVDNTQTELQLPAGAFSAAAFAPDSKKLAVSHKNSNLELIDLQAGGKSQVFSLLKFNMYPTSLAYLNGGERVVVGSGNAQVGVFDLKNNSVNVLRGHRGPINAVVAGHEPHQFFSASEQGEVLEWDARVEDPRATVIHPVLPNDEPVGFRSLSYSPDGHYLACGGSQAFTPAGGGHRHGYLFLYDTADFSRYWRWETPDPVELCSFSPDGKQLVWRERSEAGVPAIRQRPFVWQEQKIEPIEADVATEAAVLVRGNALLLGTDRGLRLATKDAFYWPVQDQRFNINVRNLFANVPGDVVGSYDLDSKLRLWNVSEQREIVWSDGHYTTPALAISADGQWAAWAAPSANASYRRTSSPETQLAEWASHQRAVVFDLQRKRIQFIVSGHATEVKALAFSADGKRLISGDEAGVLKVWDTVTGSELLSFSASKNWVFAIAIHPDSKQFVSLVSEGVKIWHCE